MGISIFENPALVNLTGLDNISSGTIGNFIIANNALLSTCDVQSVCDHLVDANAFTSISGNAPGCADNSEVEQACWNASPAIIITSQIDIDNFELNFPGLSETEGDLVIQGNDINNLNGLGVLTLVGGNLWIGNNISGNPVLTDVSGLENLAAVGGGLYIVNNTLLTQLTGLGKASINGLTNITTVGGDLWIAQNQSLNSLTGLESVTSIGGSFLINSNPALTALTGLNNIEAGSITDLFISQNTILSLCEIQSVCGVLANPNGAIVISGNASGCESVEVVLEACVVGIYESIIDPDFSIYPNPAKNEIFISVDHGQNTREVNIYSQLGQIVIQKDQIMGSIDISKLQPGIYIVEIASNRKKYRKKFLVR